MPELKMMLALVFALAALDMCTGQYGQQQYQYSQQQYQQRQQQMQYQQQQQQRQVYPNQVYQVRMRANNAGVVQPRAKPSYQRVNPSDYRRIMQQGTQQQVMVVSKQRPVQQVYYPQQYQKQQQYQYQYPQRQTHYQKPRYNHYVYPKKVVRVVNRPIPSNTYKPKWPKLKGRCHTVPNFKINGVNPIKAECGKGRVTIVFLMKRRCDFCYHQLKELNILAGHYKKSNKSLSVIAINHKKGRLSPSIKAQYPFVTFVEEPANMDLFGKLGGAWRQVIIYDVCCRKQYLYGYPFSWMGYSFVRHAIFNTYYYDQVICGVCAKPTLIPQPKTTVAATTTFNLPTERAL